MVFHNIPRGKLDDAVIARMPEKKVVRWEITPKFYYAILSIQNKYVNGRWDAEGMYSPAGGKGDGLNIFCTDQTDGFVFETSEYGYLKDCHTIYSKPIIFDTPFPREQFV